MSANDNTTERPVWANDAMNDDDIAFVEGYADAVGWLPSAKTVEIEDFLCLSFRGGIWFEMEEDHTLAKYKGWTAHPDGGIVGIFAGKFNDNGTEVGYTAGISAALRVHRPEVFRDVRNQHLDYQRKRVHDNLQRCAEQLAREQAALARVDTELAALDDAV